MVMVFEFLRWWYGPGWVDAWRKAGFLVVGIERAFSITILLKTLFLPWKQIVSLPGRSIEEKIKAGIDNLISRMVGFFARLTALLAALVLGALCAVVGFLAAVLWPLLPLVFIYLVFRSFVG